MRQISYDLGFHMRRKFDQSDQLELENLIWPGSQQWTHCAIVSSEIALLLFSLLTSMCHSCYQWKTANHNSLSQPGKYNFRNRYLSHSCAGVIQFLNVGVGLGVIREKRAIVFTDRQLRDVWGDAPTLVVVVVIERGVINSYNGRFCYCVKVNLVNWKNVKEINVKCKE